MNKKTLEHYVMRRLTRTLIKHPGTTGLQSVNERHGIEEWSEPPATRNNLQVKSHCLQEFEADTTQENIMERFAT